MTCGIYCIENLKNKKKYIGKAVDIAFRWRQHEYGLGSGYHRNRFLCRAWVKYGKENFSFCVIEECLENELSEKEIFWIAKLKTRAPNGYNLTDGGEGMTGFVHSQETRQKISIASKGKKLSFETRAKMSEAWKTRAPMSDETRAKFSEAQKGNTHFLGHKHTEEIRAKISTTHKGELCYNFGKHLSAETRARQSEANKGKHHISEEHKCKLLEARKGKPSGMFGKHHTGVTKNKISKAHIGKKKEGASSKFYGVCKISNKWEVRLSINKKVFYLGCFKSEIEAAKSYNQYIIENNLPNPLNQFSEEVI